MVETKDNHNISLGKSDLPLTRQKNPNDCHLLLSHYTLLLLLPVGVGGVKHNKDISISRHTVVCRAAQENGACANGSEYINRNNLVAIFIAPAVSEIQVSKFQFLFFVFFSSSFRTNTKTTLTQECILRSS